MKSYWLNNQSNRNLIVFFAGWSFDEIPFKFLDCGDNDVLIIYDYNDVSSLPFDIKIFEKYAKKVLITWSMGVYVANLYNQIFKDFAMKIAINGTITPVDDLYGIPKKLFELTLKHAYVGLAGKFYQNVFATENEYTRYIDAPVSRSIENRVSELENLYENIKVIAIEDVSFYNCALVSKFDKIIPFKNQVASHEKHNVKVVILDSGHAPFFNYSSWDEIIRLCQ